MQQEMLRFAGHQLGLLSKLRRMMNIMLKHKRKHRSGLLARLYGCPVQMRMLIVHVLMVVRMGRFSRC